MIEQINKKTIEKKPRKIGSGRKKGAGNKKDKYILEYNDKKYVCKTLNEIAEITNKSRLCITRIITGRTTFRKKTSDGLKNIKIKKIMVI